MHINKSNVCINSQEQDVRTKQKHLEYHWVQRFDKFKL